MQPVTLSWVFQNQQKSHDAKKKKKKKKKKNDQNILFLNERIPFNLQCSFNECGTELQILILK